ncbi:MAG: septum formation initiator family protein [Acidobacteria bacterium]|nr:septum formation initiator family protein [Acidobacteriota bacterium]
MSASQRLRREAFFILILLSAILLVYLCLFGDAGYPRLQEYRRQFHHLSLENSRLRVENEKLIQSIGQLKTNPATVEKIAREDFNFARPGDIVVTLPERR